MDSQVVGGALTAMVSEQVAVAAVGVVLAVDLVALVIVGSHIAQGETVADGDKVHRCVEPSSTLVVEIVRGG